MTLILSDTDAGITLTSPTYTNPIDILTGVTVTNAGDAVYAKTLSWTINNEGTVLGGSPGDGIRLRAGGSVTNASTALIAGVIGVYVSGAAGIVANNGSIRGTALGVELKAGGTVSNTSTGSVTGDFGVYITGAAGTVVNAGTHRWDRRPWLRCLSEGWRLGHQHGHGFDRRRQRRPAGQGRPRHGGQ